MGRSTKSGQRDRRHCHAVCILKKKRKHLSHFSRCCKTFDSFRNALMNQALQLQQIEGQPMGILYCYLPGKSEHDKTATCLTVVVY